MTRTVTVHYGNKSERQPNNESTMEENISCGEDHALIWGSEPIYPETITTINPRTGIDERNTFAKLFK